MADLNEKDLEQATGGIQFIKPVFDGSEAGRSERDLRNV